MEAQREDNERKRGRDGGRAPTKVTRDRQRANPKKMSSLDYMNKPLPGGR